MVRRPSGDPINEFWNPTKSSKTSEIFGYF